jgi:hypothetical protein
MNLLNIKKTMIITILVTALLLMIFTMLQVFNKPNIN